MKLIKAAAPLAFVLGLAGCTDDAEKFQGVWKNDMGFLLFINEGATEAKACVIGMGVVDMVAKTKVEGDVLTAVNSPEMGKIEWKKVDGKPQLLADGASFEKGTQAEWDEACK